MNKKLTILNFISLSILLFLHKVKANCPENQIPVGFKCLTEEELNICSNNLELLDGSEQNNTSITNECAPYITPQDQQAFNFTVSFPGDFKPNLTCLDIEVKFEGEDLEERPDEDTSILNKWYYDEETDEVKFNVTLADMEDLYACDFLPNSDQYTWICDMEMNILFGGIEQLTYKFEIQITMDRNANATNNADGDQMTIHVDRNRVTGKCCDNELQIDTALRFCESFECNTFLDNPLTVRRRQLFYVEHYIENEQFKHLFLEGIQIKLGPFFPQIVETNGDLAGRFIYALRANVALNDLVIESIAEIHLQNPNNQTRRFLQTQQDLGEDYKVKAEGKMSIEEEGSFNQNLDTNVKIIEKKVVNDHFKSVAYVSLGGLFIIISIIIGTKLYVNKLREKYTLADQQSQRVIQLDQTSKIGSNMESSANKRIEV